MFCIKISKSWAQIYVIFIKYAMQWQKENVPLISPFKIQVFWTTEDA